MIEQVRSYIDQYQMIQKGDTIILGISGGADSVCLLFVLQELQQELEFDLIGVHVNHNLRGADAMSDQQYVVQLCENREVTCIVVDVDVKSEALKRKRSLEETGREVRQEAFAKIGREAVEKRGKQRYKIATAHHANDNAETMLMNLSRGSGLVGLSGIAPVRGNRIRPLLGVSREEIEGYLTMHQVAYCTDHTNAENIYTRNVIRNQVIPCLEESVNIKSVIHMNQAMEELRKIESYLQMQMEGIWACCVKEKEDNHMVVSKDIFDKQEDIIKERIMKRAMETVSEQQRDITREHVMQLIELLKKQVGRQVHLPYQMIGKRVYEGIEIYRETEEKLPLEGMEMVIPGKTYLGDGSVITTRILDGNVMGEIIEKPYTQYFEYDIITEVLKIRTRKIGDYIVIHQDGKTQMLKKYYITNKIPEDQRDEVPLIALEDEILWVVGYRRGSSYRVSKNTKKVLEIQYDGGNHVRDN